MGGGGFIAKRKRVERVVVGGGKLLERASEVTFKLSSLSSLLPLLLRLFFPSGVMAAFSLSLFLVFSLLSLREGYGSLLATTL